MNAAVTPRRLKKFLLGPLRLRRYFRRPGEGRVHPDLPACVLLWAQVIAYVLREYSFHGIESLVCSGARRGLGVGCSFGDDALGYFTERLNAEATRRALAQVLLRTKRNKAFDAQAYVGFALDGTGAGHSREARCGLCRPQYNAKHEVIGYTHGISAISVVGAGLPLPFDVEPYGPGDSEYSASQRLLRRAVNYLGRRFAQYVVVDGEYATAPFLHAVQDVGLHVVARLKGNLPGLFAAAQARFGRCAPTCTFKAGKDRIELWDADDFDPWENLRWTTVRVIRYRQHKPDGTVCEAYWLTDFPKKRVGPKTLYRMAKSRWEIENGTFNDGKNRYGLKHVPHHQDNSLVIHWLLVLFAMTIERLYRVRHLRRGFHQPLSAIEFVRLLRLSLASPAYMDTS